MHIPFQVIHTLKLPDGSYELYLDIAASQQVFLGYLLEGLNDYCYHTITDSQVPFVSNGDSQDNEPGKKLLKITVVPDYYEDVVAFLSHLNS